MYKLAEGIMPHILNIRLGVKYVYFIICIKNTHNNNNHGSWLIKHFIAIFCRCNLRLNLFLANNIKNKQNKKDR